MPLPPTPLVEGLSPSQAEAVTRTEGHLLVLAGAGSGKTRVITHRLGYLLIDKGVPPHRILAVTFTNKAAREMRERVGDLLGDRPPPNLWVSTFHALGAKLLRRHAKQAGLREGFTIFDEDDALRLVKRILKEMGLDPKVNSASSIRGAIGRYKCDLLTPDDVMQSPDVHDHVPGKVYARYEEELREQNGVDFGDLIVRPVKMLRESDEVRTRYQDRFRYLMVDEYQDTNHAQYVLIRLLAGKDAHVCAVGDEDQSIYGWRGADIRNILDFRQDFPGTEVLQLEQNYRCPTAVLDAANAMIAHNNSRLKEREVFSEISSEHKVGYRELPDAEQEARFLKQAIRYLRLEEDLEWSDFAVFYRTHAQARAIEQIFNRPPRIPYEVFGGLKFYERRVVKDLVAYLRLLVNPYDRESMARVVGIPKRGIGAKALAKLQARSISTGEPILELLADTSVMGGKAGKAGKDLFDLLDELRKLQEDLLPAEILALLIERLDYESYVAKTTKLEDMEHVLELSNALVEYARGADDPSLIGFLEQAALVSPTDRLDQETGKVSLMTLHNAKGLEFPIVFLTGLEQGLLPHANSFAAGSIEEERRLLYVGMTRAKKRLFLSRAESRIMYGEWERRLESEFIEEIGPENLFDAYE